jgi:hypothetical protein
MYPRHHDTERSEWFVRVFYRLSKSRGNCTCWFRRHKRDHRASVVPDFSGTLCSSLNGYFNFSDRSTSYSGSEFSSPRQNGIRLIQRVPKHRADVRLLVTPVGRRTRTLTQYPLLGDLTPMIDSPILCFRCIPLAVLSRLLFPDREAARSRSMNIRAVLGPIRHAITQPAKTKT